MWIRSQNKELLIKTNNMLFVREIVNAGYAIAYDLYNNDEFINLGIYKSKERAIEVLDEISRRIQLIETFKAFGIDEEKVKLYKLFLNEKEVNALFYPYQMPEE